jgi:hypothetical protein
MAAPTEKELEQKRARNERLREQIADAEAKAAAATTEQSLSLEGATLDAETARLEARLAAAKEAAKISNIKSGVEGPLAAVNDQLEAARAGITPPGVTVDTNAENAPKDTTGATTGTTEEKE